MSFQKLKVDQIITIYTMKHYLYYKETNHVYLKDIWVVINCRLLKSHIKKQTIDTENNLDESPGNYVKWKMPIPNVIYSMTCFYLF